MCDSSLLVWGQKGGFKLSGGVINYSFLYKYRCLAWAAPGNTQGSIEK